MTTGTRRPFTTGVITLAIAVLATTITGWTGATRASAEVRSVAVAGTFGSAIGCDGDWDTDCSAAQLTARGDGLWSRTITVPAGTYEYKATLNGSWSENYGANAVAGGANIPLTVPAGGRAVTFVYDPVTHWIADDVNRRIVTAAGSFQSELGCSADWAPDCLRSLTTDVDGDGTYAFTTSAIPAGSWQVKATIGQSWVESYGQGGAAGANIEFTVPTSSATTTFSYNSASPALTVQTGGAQQPGSAIPNTLGALYTAASTTFRIWSPDSSNVSVTVDGTTHSLSAVILPGYSDVYQAVVPGDLKLKSYQFAIGSANVRDPYARMVNPGTTQGVVVDVAAVQPTGGRWVQTPALINREDAVIYELNVRDFTIDPSSGVSAATRGKFLGLVQGGTTFNGVKTGIDHLKELGVTHVQLLPAFDFKSTVPNWGYDPLNYTVPEEQFSTSSGYEDRIREFKDMVNAFHDNGIRVIMDVVYNHTASKDVLQGITGKYYTPTDLSATGNSIDDGNAMVSAMIRDSLETWVREYNIDGFRFDLFGIHTTANASEWGSHLNSLFPERNLLIYGEPWSADNNEPLQQQKVRYGSVPTLADAHVGVFNGAYRDAIKGGTQDTVVNYMGGNGNAADIVRGSRGSLVQNKSTAPLADPWNPAFAFDPEQTINYVSAHDDLNLWDKITYSGAPGGSTGAAGRIDRFATGIVFTSQGIPFISEGDEFLHSKVVNGGYEAAKNSYEAGDDVNAIQWSEKVNNDSTFQYYRGAIALRRSSPALRLTTWDAINDQQTTQTAGSVVVSRISSNPSNPTDHDTVVVYNPGDAPYTAPFARRPVGQGLRRDGSNQRQLRCLPGQERHRVHATVGRRRVA